MSVVADGMNMLLGTEKTAPLICVPAVSVHVYHACDCTATNNPTHRWRNRRGRMGLGPSLFCLNIVSLSSTISVGSSDKVNRLMKKMLQNFGSIIFNILFVIWQWICQDFVIVWQDTPCTVCHPAMDCFPHWCCWTVLPDGVIQHNFSQKWCHFTCLCTWAPEGIFPGGATSGFFQRFSTGDQKWWNLFFTTRN